MEREHIIGRLISGFGVKAAAVAAAFYLAHEVYSAVAPVFHAISKGLVQ